jgi:transcriptional regulator with XRE-family HTH domain
MAEPTDKVDEDTIGSRARVIRRRRGLSLKTAAGLAGISKPYLSMLENGERGFTKRGLVEDLAYALGCAVVDLTGEPNANARPDRRTAAANAAVPVLNRAFYDVELSDVPDIPHRPLATLVTAVTTANIHADHNEYDLAGRGLGDLVTELQVVAATGTSDEQRAALASLAEACIVVGRLARITGHAALSVTAAQRGWHAAQLIERPDLVGLTKMSEAGGLLRMGARRRAKSVIRDTLTLLEGEPGPTPGDTMVAEALGMLHLHASMLAAREHDSALVETHLSEARSLAAHTGEQNHLQLHFGIVNTAIWELSIGVESGNGPAAAARFVSRKVDLSLLGSRGRESSMQFDLARAWAQAGGVHDDKVLRALDAADRLAPIRVRSDPLARDLGMSLRRRARRRVWELDSLLNRLGLA